MTYDAQEISTQDGAPVELYAFSHGVSAYRYTSREASFTDTTVSPNRIYTSASIERTPIASTQEDARNAVQLTVSRENDVAELFRVSPPSETVALTIKRVHRGDTASLVTVWVGRVLNCTFAGARAILQCEPITISLKRTGLSRLYSKTCQFVLYGAACGVDQTAFDTVTKVTAVSGLTITVRALPAYTFGGGFVTWVNSDGNTERRFIESAVVAGTSPDTVTLTLTQAFSGLAVTSPLQSVTVFPGCDRSLSICNSQFANAVNYGGWPYFPEKNPFNGNPL